MKSTPSNPLHSDCIPQKNLPQSGPHAGSSRFWSFLKRQTWLPLTTALLLPTLPAAGDWQWQNPPVVVDTQTVKRNNIFYKGETVVLKLTASGASRYVIRDYYGNIVETGPVSGSSIAPQVRDPGWYRVALYGNDQGMPYGDSVGSSMFSIIRDTPNFPKLPAVGTSGGVDWFSDSVLRGVFGYGPQRHKVDNASAPDAEIAKLATAIDIDQKYYKSFDPVRKRELLVVFPNGTTDSAGVRKIVERFKGVVKYWEARNEPNFFMSATAFVNNELKPFYELVKSVDPSLKVMGPGAVSVGPPMAGWNDEFFRAGGGKYIDAFSFHAYNCVNGDLTLVRQSFEQIDNWLRQYNLAGIEKWQTEQGFYGPTWGGYQPRMQGRWTMLQMMTYEQYGIPKEHNHYWYDRNGGFWDHPCWIENGDESVNPVGPLLRVWAEELYGTNYVSKYDFGSPGNQLFVGNLFAGEGKQVAAFMTSGDTQSQLELTISGAASVKVVSPFGMERTLPVVAGKVTVPVGELPTYVEFTGTLAVSRSDWGPNLARQTGVSAAASGATTHPIFTGVNNSIGKIINGQLESWYWTQAPDAHIWSANNASYPGWVEVRLPSAQSIDRVVIYAGVLWQADGSILDYQLQVDQGGQWVTVDSVKEPVNTFRTFNQANHTTVDSFYSERPVFTHSFAPVTTQKIRLLVNDVTWGGASNKELKDAGSQSGVYQLNLREIEVYRSGISAPANKPPVAVADSATCFRDGSVSIPVLSNDSDPDSGPYGLSVVGVGTPARGTASVANGRVVYRPAQGVSGTDSFSYTISDGLKTATASVSVVISNTTDPVAQPVNGLLAEYYDNSDLTALVMTRVDPYIDWNWGAGSPDPKIGVGSFSVRWSGKLVPKNSELVTFYTTSDDGVRLWVNGQQLVNNWTTHPATVNQAAIQLLAGQAYDIKLEYFQGGSGSEIKLEWSSPSMPREIIPYSNLFASAQTTVIPPVTANQLPIATADTAWTSAGTATLISVLTNDSDPDAAPLPISVLSATSPANGNVVVVANQIRYTPKVGFSGTDTFNYSMTDGAGTASAAVTVTVAAPDPTRLSGLKGEYFLGVNFNSLILSRLDAGVNFDWVLGSPDPALPSDGFSVRWTGAVTARFSERYTFFVSSDDGVRVWVNGQLIADNWTDHPVTENAGTISLTAGQLNDLKVEFYEQQGEAVAKLEWQSASQPREIVPAAMLSAAPFTPVMPPLPKPANIAPVASNDAAATPEGVPVTIAVLANDGDADAGPNPLSILSVTKPARGTAIVATGGVRYTPDSGFYGSDQFSYTVTDGSATASAGVSVSVNSTAVAYDLSAGGLSGSLVGTGSGSSRVLADGSWELNTSGAGASGVADSLRMEGLTVVGDFRAKMRVQSFAAISDAARVGVMLRESFASGARSAMLSVTPSNQLRVGARLVTGGTYNEVIPSAAISAGMPNAWLMLERQGDVVRMSASLDGIAFTQIGSYTITALGSSLQVGLSAASGSSTLVSRAVVSDWTFSRLLGAPQVTQSGLLGTYFTSTNLTAPAVVRVDETVDFDWALKAPHPQLAADNFSVRWEGQLNPKFSEQYTFYTQSDDGVRLWVNGVQLVNNWTIHGVTENSGRIALKAGVPVDVRLEFYDGAQSAVCKLLWSSPSQPKQVVPTTALRPTLRAVPVGVGATASVATLADGVKELQAVGLGLRAGSAEQGGFLSQPRSGNFQNTIRIRSVTGGVAPKCALMLREGVAASDRFAALNVASDGSLALVSRSVAGGSVVSVPVAGRLTAPDVWVAFERKGDRISFAVSRDDITYASAGFVELLGLPQIVQCGPFLGSGSSTIASKAAISDYEVAPMVSTGLTAQYFGTQTLSGLRLTRVDQAVDFTWGNSSPDARVLAADGYSVRWTGKVKSPVAGPVTFFTQSDDGIRLWVNGQLLINNWTEHALTENVGAISLSLGQWVDLKLEFYEKAGEAAARLLWSAQGLPKQVVPASLLSTE
jgi:hypothetical protein